MYIVYKLIFPNSKVYIGLTKNSIKERFAQHIWHRNQGKHRPIYTAMRKYKDLVIPEVLEENLTLAEAEYLEKYYIKCLNSNNRQFGYNLSAGGTSGNIQSEQGKKAWKEKMQIHYDNPEYNKKITKHLIDRKFNDPDYFKKQSEYISNYFSDEQNRIKHSIVKGGKPFICNETNEIFYSLPLAGEKLSVSHQNIWKVLKGLRKQTQGYTFKYI